MNNKGFAITTVLYGTLILFFLLLVSMLGILATYKNNLDKLINATHGTREILEMKPITDYPPLFEMGLFCQEGECYYFYPSGDPSEPEEPPA